MAAPSAEAGADEVREWLVTEGVSPGSLAFFACVNAHGNAVWPPAIWDANASVGMTPGASW